MRRAEGSTQSPPRPTQSPSQPAYPAAWSPIRASARPGGVIDLDLDALRAGAPQRGGGAGDLEAGVRIGALEDPATVAEEPFLGGVGEHRRDRSLVVPDHGVDVASDARRTERQDRVGPTGGRGGGAAQHPVAERLGLEVREQCERPDLGVTRGATRCAHRGPWRDRLAGDDVGQQDPDLRPRSPAAPCRPRRPTPYRSPSTSVIAGPPDGPVSPGTRRRTTTL